jgi:hypothetical protein
MSSETVILKEQAHKLTVKRVRSGTVWWSRLGDNPSAIH